MPRGDKSSYTDRQKRKTRHIEEGYEERGVSEKEAAQPAWATANKQDHGCSHPSRAAARSAGDVRCGRDH